MKEGTASDIRRSSYIDWGLLMELLYRHADGRSAFFSNRSDGNARNSEVAEKLIVAAGGRYQSRALLRQTHSSIIRDSAELSQDGEIGKGQLREPLEGDAIFVDEPRSVPIILVADCAPVVIFDSSSLCYVAIHAGWRGIYGGIIQGAIDRLRAAGSGELIGVVGPHAGICCYEFSSGDADIFSQKVGTNASVPLEGGAVALDIYGSISHLFQKSGVLLQSTRPPCTICDERYFSYRGGDLASRMAMFVVGSDS
ncbi:polyphenol oxidase family protein [Acidithrix sp. C25]|uniref:polyphenol oxidase family protein n=1 Tax=Acidithrix sp. C25 TaxID=1671482 RepID=UPI00191BC202|nr:polyphenol oxidase family protein [Acidithrix sp. C25]